MGTKLFHLPLPSHAMTEHCIEYQASTERTFESILNFVIDLGEKSLESLHNVATFLPIGRCFNDTTQKKIYGL